MKNKLNKIIIPLSIVVAVLIIDTTFTGYSKYGYNYVRCNSSPVKVTKTSFFGGGIFYELPGDYTPMGTNGIEYYCSVLEAKEEYPSIGEKL